MFDSEKARAARKRRDEISKYRKRIVLTWAANRYTASNGSRETSPSEIAALLGMHEIATSVWLNTIGIKEERRGVIRLVDVIDRAREN